MKVLELFSGTHSIGVVCKKLNIDVVSLDRDLNADSKMYDYISQNHIKADIMTWDYKKDYKKGDFDIITASPVCLWWSILRKSWIGRKSKKIHPTEIITRNHIDNDIKKFGMPMVNKVFEIIEFFEPKFWWVENPQTGEMKNYIESNHKKYNTFYDVDYCKYSDWGYQKRTRFWTNIKDFKPELCKKDCINFIEKKHKKSCSGHTNKLERYRIPEKLITELLKKCI
jgi:site-specific DNA-cytosine methylase